MLHNSKANSATHCIKNWVNWIQQLVDKILIGLLQVYEDASEKFEKSVAKKLMEGEI